MAPSRRAFIAAPLVGTMIFLICLMVVVSLGRSEANRVNNVVSGSYHNRLASIVETYRSDLGVNFNTGLQRMIEYGLTSECWFNFANIKTERVYHSSDGSVSDEQAAANDVADLSLPYLTSVQTYIEGPPGPNDLKTVTEAEERFFSCNRINSILEQITCPCGGGSYGLPEWINSIKGTASDPDVSFEGIKLSLLPDDVVVRFGCLSSNPSRLCEEMVSGIKFDCRDFALRGSTTKPAYAGVYANPGSKPFQCCKYAADHLDPNGVPIQDCVDTPGVSGNEKITGCETGTLFVGIDIESDDVYPYMPRIQASDTSGNVIRAGAISDKNFNAPVTYPLFKYMDAAFYFNRRIAFGADASKTLPDTDTHGYDRGVFAGTCMGAFTPGNGCENDAIRGVGGQLPGMSTSTDFGPAPASETVIQNSLSDQFFEKVVNVSCLKVHNTYLLPSGSGRDLGESNLQTLFCASGCTVINNIDPNAVIGAGNNWQECGQVESMASGSEVLPLTSDWKKGLFGVTSVQCTSEAPPGYCAFIKSTPSTKLLFIDNNPAVRVDPFSPNQFCWYSRVSYQGMG